MYVVGRSGLVGESEADWSVPALVGGAEWWASGSSVVTVAGDVESDAFDVAEYAESGYV